MAHRFTIGVEEEFQIIDPDTLELRSHVVQLLSSAAARGVGDLVKQEMHQSIVETGTGGSIMDWAVGPAVVEKLAVEAPVQRPQFAAGDGLLFDELFLHRTGVDPTMTHQRYAIEAWFFARSSYPDGQVPLVW